MTCAFPFIQLFHNTWQLIKNLSSQKLKSKSQTTQMHCLCIVRPVCFLWVLFCPLFQGVGPAFGKNTLPKVFQGFSIHDRENTLCHISSTLSLFFEEPNTTPPGSHRKQKWHILKHIACDWWYCITRMEYKELQVTLREYTTKSTLKKTPWTIASTIHLQQSIAMTMCLGEWHMGLYFLDINVFRNYKWSALSTHWSSFSFMHFKNVFKIYKICNGLAKNFKSSKLVPYLNWNWKPHTTLYC